MAIVECPKCFTKWYFHARDLENGQYGQFKKFIEFGMQKHFKK